MKCRVCRGPAVIDVRRHNAAFCPDHFVAHCQEQVRRAEHDMIRDGDRVLVAVSGGKDSLALWDLLLGLGYDVDGLYLGLGIGEYSGESAQYARDYAAAGGHKLHEVDLESDLGFSVPGAAASTRRAPCGACGLSKRHLFNSFALDHAYDVVATGHNLDDEAAVLLGNVLRWEAGYLGRQHPLLPAAEGFVRKVKPLYRMGERETAAYCVVARIDYQVEECPMAAGNRHLGYKIAHPEPRPRSCSASWTARRDTSPRRLPTSAARSARAASAGHRRRPRCAPSADCARRRRVRCRSPHRGRGTEALRVGAAGRR